MLAQAWKIARIGSPDQLYMESDELPPVAPGEALVRLRAVGLNRSDLMYVAGRYMKPPQPGSCLGQEGVGEIVELGPPLAGADRPGGVELQVGMRVGFLVGRVDIAKTGTYRSLGIYRQDALLPVPESLSNSEGAGFWMGVLTAGGALSVGGLTSRTHAVKRVLITAASSGMGVIALQLARGFGAETFAATTSESKRKRLEDVADHVIVTSEPGQLVSAIDELTGGTGVDVAFDPVGLANSAALFKVAAVDGHIVYYGMLAGTEAPLDLVSLLRKDLALHGYTVHRLLRDKSLLESVVEDALQMAGAGKLRPAIAHELPFERAPEALATMARNEHFGKIVLTLG